MRLFPGKIVKGGFVISLVLLAFIGIFSVRGIIRLLDAYRWERHTNEVITSLDDILSNLEDEEVGVYGFIVTGNATYLKTYSTTIRVVDRQVNEIAKLTLDNPGQQRRIDILKPLLVEKNALTDELLDLWKNKRFMASNQWLLSDREKILMENVQNLVHEMKKEEDALLKQRSEEVGSSTRTIIFLIIAGNLTAFAFVILSGILVYRDIALQKKVAEELKKDESFQP